MADFTSLVLALNTGSQATPTWTAVPSAGGGQEMRFSDSGAVSLTTASASWPYITRPASGTAAIPYVYVFSADTTYAGGYLSGGTGAGPAAFSNANFNEARWQWDATGTFASAPIFTWYPTNAHGAVTRGDNSLLGGNTTDTGATQRSYIKGNMYGTGATTQTPAAAPTNAPAVTDGTTGSLSPATGAWLTNYQSMQGDNDYITYGSTPTATTAQNLYVMFAAFMGANLATGTYLPVASLKYTFV